MLKNIIGNFKCWPFLRFGFVLMLVRGVRSETILVETCPETTAVLPCPALTPTEDDDRSLAAFWYKDDQVTPFYMVDGRTSVSIDRGKHRQLSDLGKRAHFNVTSEPALLYLEVHSKEDAGLYACRVDWYRSLTRTSMVQLKVLALTPKLIIYEDEKELPEVAGPYREGSDLHLACELTGGDLEPMLVIWMIQDTVIDSTFEILPNGKTRNEHVLRGLKRSLWMVPVTCMAVKHLNSTNDPALARAVQIDLFLRPLGVRITPNHGLCKEGSVVDFRCRAWGSRPAAEITWWMKNFRLYNVTGRIVDRDSSSSSLSLMPLASDHGNVITCRAENPKLPGRIAVDNVTLNVTFPPKVSLSLKTYSSSTLSEGDTVALICRVISNPLAGPVQWSFVKESSVLPKQDDFPKSGTHTLVLERLEPWHKGSYRCKATNSEGSGESNALWLAIRHRPICRAGIQVSYGVHQGETLSIRCEVEAEPAEVSFHWSFANTLVHHNNVSFISRGLKSIATYTPTKDIHLGSLFCWANNSAGEQHVPFTFTVFRPSKPNPPKNCRSSNRTQSSFVVSCEPSYDGGSTQQFHFRARLKDSSDGEVSLNARLPVFTLTNLPSGSTFEIIISSVNKIGSSEEVRLETTTLQGKEKGQWPVKSNRGFLISSLLILFFATLTLVAAAVLRHRSHPFSL